MSDDQLPPWAELLKQRVAELERRFTEAGVNPSESSFAGDGPPFDERKAGEGDLKTTGPADGQVEQKRLLVENLEREIQSARTRLDQARQEADAAQERAAQATRRADEARAALEARAAAVQAEAAGLGQTQRMIERLWPRFLLTDAFKEWRSGIEDALQQETPPSCVALLFANLHGYTACLLESDQKYLRDVLRDISRFLYAWLKERGQDEHAAFDLALAWAAAFNEECAGRCEIEVPEPGTPANNVSMTFPPRGSSPEVVSVRTWCVRDAQRRVIHRAEVFT